MRPRIFKVGILALCGVLLRSICMGAVITDVTATLPLQSTDASPTVKNISVTSGTLVLQSTSAAAGNPILLIQNQAKAELIRIQQDGKLGIGTTAPTAKLDVQGGEGINVQYGINAATGSFNATGNAQFSLQTSSGVDVGEGVYAEFFVGDGSALTNVTGSDPTKVAKAGDTMTGQLTLSASSLTVTGTGGAGIAYGLKAGSASFSGGMTASSGTFTAAGNSQYSVQASSGMRMDAGCLRFPSGNIQCDASLSAAAGAGLGSNNTFTGINTFTNTGSNIPIWTKFTVSSSAFAVAYTTADAQLFSLPAQTALQAVVIKHTAPFTGGGVTAYMLSVGISGNLNKYASAFDVFQATSSAIGQMSNSGYVEDFSGATSVRIAATSTGGNLNAVTAGSVDVWVQTSALP